MKTIENYIKLEKDEFRKVKLAFAYETINRIDKIINYHNENEEVENDAIYLSIFGLLQSLFVAIDSLYDFTLEITNSKSHININKNEILNRLKYIRNDVVGHPINRRYGRSSVGYAVIKTDNLTYDKFEYIIYIKNKNGDLRVNSYVVDLNELKSSYLKEKNAIISKLSHFINKKFKQTNISLLLKKLYKDLNLEVINKIRVEHDKNFGNIHSDRFNWRLDLLEVLVKMKPEFQKTGLFSIFDYLKTLQINKLIVINNELENKNTKVEKIKIPDILNNVFKYLTQNKNLIDYLKDLHDINSPYYGYNLTYLLENVKNEDFLKLLKVLEGKTDRNKVYLIGSILNNYNKSLSL